MLITDRDYCKAILISKNMGFSSIEKFFLIRVICSFGVSEEVMSTVEELVKVLTLSEKVLSRTRDELIIKGHLKKSSKPLTNGGRPRICFKISPHLLDSLQTSELGREHCISLCIEKMLFTATLQDIYVPDREGNNRKIKPPVRILICVFLAHSTDVGLVSGLGHADLRKLIGSSLERLKSQMATLHAVGFILARRSGFTDKQTGKLFKGQYALNFAWQGLSNVLKPKAVVFCLGRLPASGESKLHKDEILNLEYRSMMRKYGGITRLPIEKSIELMSKIDKNMQRHISWIIFESVCYLSNRWPEVGETNENIIKEIGQDFKDMIRANISSIWDEGSFKELIDFINGFVDFYAFKFARKIITLSENLFVGDRKGARYFLVPSDYDFESRGFCVAIFDSYGVGGTTVIQKVFECKDGSNKIKLISTYENTNEIEQNLKNIYGFV